MGIFPDIGGLLILSRKAKIEYVFILLNYLYFQDRSAIFAAAPSYSKRSVEGEGAAALQ